MNIIFHHRTEKIQHLVIGKLGLQFFNKHLKRTNEQALAFQRGLGPRVFALVEGGVIWQCVDFCPKAIKLFVNFFNEIVAAFKMLLKTLLQSCRSQP